MTAHLTIEINFANGRYHGLEWPPAPMRLLQAMVAGAGAACGQYDNLPPHFIKLIQWLENQPAPIILAAHVPKASSHLLSVPNNSDDLSMAAYSSGRTAVEVEAARRKRLNLKPMPRRLVENSVTYVWQVKEDDLGIAREVAGLAHFLYRLGRGVDAAWAIGTVVERLRTDMPHWRPASAHGEASLRVPVPGSVASLIRRQQARRSKIALRDYVDPRITYREQAYTAGSESRPRLYSIYSLRSTDGSRPFSWRQSDCITMAAMLRHAVIERVPATLRSFAAGHAAGDANPSHRLSWVPLPSIGHQHADGRIRRVMVLGPAGLQQDVFDEVTFGLQFETLKHDGRDVALLIETKEVDGAVVPYIQSSAEWQTVTPVILPGFTSCGRKQSGRLSPKKIESLVHKALAREGYPPAMEVAVQKAPLYNGSLAVGDYRASRYMHYPRLHMRVLFARPVQGPVLAGVGRHYGLGLFAGRDCREF